MFSAYFSLLIFLPVVGRTDLEDFTVKSNCNWACEIVNARPWPWKTVLSNTGHLKAKFLLNKRVEQECERFTKEANTSESIKVWIYTRQVACIAGSNGFSLLTSAILGSLPSFQFLPERNYRKQDVNISCIFRQTSGQTSNESNGSANGLEAVYSPYFYIKDEAANFSKNIKPFLSYIWSENIFTVSARAGCTERDETAKFFHQFEGWQWTVLSALIHLLWIFCTLYSTYFLTLFLPNISTVEGVVESSNIRETTFHPEEELDHDGRSLVSLVADARQSQPIEQEDSVKEFLKQTEHDGRSVLGRQSAWRLKDVDEWLEKNTVNLVSLDDCDDHSEVNFSMDKDNPVQQTNTVNGRRYSADSRATENSIISESLGVYGYTNLVRSPTTREQDSYVNDPERNPDHIVEPYRLQPCILPIHNGQNSDSKNSVCVIHFGGGPSQVGLRSFVATKLLKYRLINFAFLLSAPVFIFLLVDIAFVLLPGLILGIDTLSLPSASMTKSVLLFVYEYPCLLMMLFFYFLRILGLCFFESSANWVPCFSCRKHVWCFIGGNYITQFFCPNQFTACDECKNVDCPKQCEFRVFLNIKYHVDNQLDIPKKNWKDVKDAFDRMFPDCCQCGHSSHSNDNSTRCWTCSLKTFIKYVVIFIPFLVLCVLDFGLSSPIISLCYGRVWFSTDWFEGKRVKQFLCLFCEFIVISFSIVWAIYLSVCCSKALVVAVISLVIACVNYPEETLSTYAIITLFWLILWDQYCTFTERYAKLDLVLFNICTENHSKKLKQYQKGDEHTYFPKDLVDSVHRKLMPLSKSVRKVILTSLFFMGVYVLILLVSTSTKKPKSNILPVFLTFLVVIIVKFLQCYSNGREKKKELTYADLKEVVKRHVAAYFEGKVD